MTAVFASGEDILGKLQDYAKEAVRSVKGRAEKLPEQVKNGFITTKDGLSRSVTYTRGVLYSTGSQSIAFLTTTVSSVAQAPMAAVNRSFAAFHNTAAMSKGSYDDRITLMEGALSQVKALAYLESIEGKVGDLLSGIASRWTFAQVKLPFEKLNVEMSGSKWQELSSSVSSELGMTKSLFRVASSVSLADKTVKLLKGDLGVAAPNQDADFRPVVKEEGVARPRFGQERAGRLRFVVSFLKDYSKRTYDALKITDWCVKHKVVNLSAKAAEAVSKAPVFLKAFMVANVALLVFKALNGRLTAWDAVETVAIAASVVVPASIVVAGVLNVASIASWVGNTMSFFTKESKIHNAAAAV